MCSFVSVLLVTVVALNSVAKWTGGWVYDQEKCLNFSAISCILVHFGTNQLARIKKKLPCHGLTWFTFALWTLFVSIVLAENDLGLCVECCLYENPVTHSLVLSLL